MPTNRRRLMHGRTDRLTIRQKCFLAVGSDLLNFPGEAGVTDEAHARRLWARWRDVVLADRDLNQTSCAGMRPWAMWRFDFDLVRGACGCWRWPRGVMSEAHMVRRLLIRGEIAEQVPGEIGEIEAAWLGLIRVAAIHDGRRPSGIPPAFWRAHAHAIVADVRADRDAYRASLAQPGRGNGAAASTAEH
jgi:hypothetical protein